MTQTACTPRVAVIQDLSCVGRCSLGVAMAVLPALGAEAAVLPTAILSAHTAFSEFTFLDFAPEAGRILDHWRRMELRFDAIYIGYLGSVELVELAARFIELFRRPGVRVVLDPAFGDHGRLYTGFGPDYVRAMRGLCARADIILPNVTEACFLLDVPYGEDAAHSAMLAERSAALLRGELRNVLITSCRFPGGETGLICVGDDGFEYPHEELELACHGSGDVFASAFVGLYIKCGRVERAARAAADFTFECIRNSMRCPDHRWYGVDYERMLPALIRTGEEFER